MKTIKKELRILLVITLIISLNIPIISLSYKYEENSSYIWSKNDIVNTDTNKAKEPILNSKCAVVFDRESKSIIFGKNENKKVPMASTTKIMTAIVLLENINKNKSLSLDTKIKVCEKAASVEGSRLGLKKGDKISINDLLYGLMLCSRK